MKMGMNSIYIFLSISLNLFSNIICGNQVIYNVSSSSGSGGKSIDGINNSSTNTISHNIWPPTDNELDNEFEKRVKNVGWSTWSEWSTCSRSCDGGVAQQLRRCHSQQGCRGERVRYKICNMQSCPEMQDFRAHQCSAYDDVPYDSTLFKWTPHYDYAEPCALTCRGRPAHLKDDNEESDSVGLDDEPSVIVQLAGRVQDGTRCRTGSLDMCIQGKCQRVGCDLKIGSAKKVDACGICGGDGSSCSQTLYQWEIAPMSLCSVTCGGGYKMSRPTCSNRITGMDVEESLCSIATRPEPSVVQCNTHMCPAKWITDEWSPCSKSCGNGMKERAVVCIEESNGIRNKVPDETCRGVKPITMEPCNVQDCSNWITKDWSGCSVSCGSGLQQRIVECIDAYGTISITCDQKIKPVTTQECSTGISCSTEKHEPSESSNIEDMDNERFNADDPVHVHRLTKSYLHQDELPPISSLREQTKSKYPEVHQRVPSEATFIKDAEWSPCSVTCGEGLRTKHFRCKIYLEFSRTTATLNESVCSGSQKPAPEVERCIMESCSLAYGDDNNNPRYSMKVGVSEPGKSYIWVEQGYTSCTASCLGGVEELIINCLREDTGKVVSPFLCTQETKPEARIRTCNDLPCPPRWNYSEYTACTKSCGIGIREREVQCIHEVTRGGENTMIVPNNMCPHPPPTERMYCNILDCPVRWETSAWSRCSKSCGGGIKERRVECKQIMVHDHKVERRPEMCPSQKPPDKKPCNTKQCAPDEQRPQILTNNSTFIQHDPRKNKVTVKIGGAATIFYGIQIKIKCPVKKYNRTKIRWSKDNQYLGKSKRIKISKKGALRILDVIFRDAGKYGCHAGLSSADLHLSVKPKPGDELSNTEYLRYKTEEEQFNSRDSTRADSQQSPYAVESKNGETNDRNQSNVKSKQRETNNRNSNKQSGLHEDVSNLSDEHEEQLNDDNPHTAASSSGTRTIALPHFQHLLASLQFLWPFQSFSNSKGHRLLMEYGGYPQTVGVHRDGDRLEKDEPVGGFSLNALQSKGSDDIFVLGSGSRENVKFEWFISPWSTCSQTCGTNNGYKTRKAYCMVRLNNATQNVDNHLCSDAGLSVPEIIEKCGNSECPRWITNEWQLCLQSRCLRQNTSIQKRSIFCKFTNGTISNKCEKHNRPISQQECFNERCKGIWRVEPWSECNAACGRQGSKFRILKCVWYGTRRPAGDECKLQQRPAVIKLCKGPPCISNFIDCKDTSRYCKNAKSMGFCRLHRYQQKCCRSCRLNFYNNMK